MAYLQLTDLRKSFGDTVAVENFSLDVAAGEFISFLGPSGCGKTTTMRMVAGFETPDTGRIRIDGEDITHTPANKRRVGMVFQSYALFPHLTVRDNVAFGLDLMRMSKPDSRTLDQAPQTSVRTGPSTSSGQTAGWASGSPPPDPPAHPPAASRRETA